MPRAPADDEIPASSPTFAQAARNAQAAGFDAVGARRQRLLDQFLRDGSNRRSGPYGGPIAHRARLLLDVLDAVRGLGTGARSASHFAAQQLQRHDRQRPDRPRHLARPAPQRLPLAWLHLMRADFSASRKATW